MKKRTKPRRLPRPFNSKLILGYGRRTLAPWVLNGLKVKQNTNVDVNQLARLMTSDKNLSTNAEVSSELVRYAEHVDPDNPSNFIVSLMVGSRLEDHNTKEMEEFYTRLKIHNSKKRSVNVNLDEFNIARCLYLGHSGKDWCVDAMEAFAEIIPGHDQELFAKIFALTSPRVELRTNLANALSSYDSFKSKRGRKFKGVLPSVKIMLTDLRNGTFVFDRTVHTSRRKVINFALALLGDKDAVVVDARIMEVCGIVRAYKWLGAGYTITPTKGEYDAIEDYVRTLARITGYEPRQIISMMWAGKKSLNIKNKTVDTKQVLKDLVVKQ